MTKEGKISKDCKECKVCGIVKNIYLFPIAPNNSDNRSNQCKTCNCINSKRDYKIKTKNELDFEKTHGVGYRKFLRWLKKEHLMGLSDLSKGRVSFFTKEFRDYLKTKQRRN